MGAVAVAGGTNDDLTFAWRAKPHRIIAAVQLKLQRLELIHQDYASRRKTMHRLLALFFAIPVLVLVRSGQVPARATSSDDVTVVRADGHARSSEYRALEDAPAD
jgi:hypothetical protein